MKALKYDLKIGKIILRKTGFAGKLVMLKYRKDWSVPEIFHSNQVQVKTILKLLVFLLHSAEQVLFSTLYVIDGFL